MILNAAHLHLPDGAGLQWAALYLDWLAKRPAWIARIAAYPWLCVSAIQFTCSARRRARIIPERVTGTDTVESIARIAAAQHKKIFLLGSFVTEQAAAVLEKRYGPIIAGTSELSPQEHDRAIQAINDSKADILIVAYGAPTQEQWIDQHKDRLAHIGLYMGVGGALDMIAGATERAPTRMRSHVEWLWRLSIQPKRIKRIVHAVIIFPLTLAWHALKNPRRLSYSIS